jgi:C_GCAxxG_C_C family probable redox protein
MLEQEARETLLDRVEQDSGQLQKELHACARCALFGIGRNLKLADDACLEVALKAAIPLSGGIAGTRNHCGALIGGIMAIGLGMVEYDARTSDPAARKPVTAAAKAFYRWFEKEIGHARCYDIREVNLGRFFDMDDPEEAKKFADAGGHELCAGVVGKAARKAAEIILDARDAKARAFRS